MISNNQIIHKDSISFSKTNTSPYSNWTIGEPVQLNFFDTKKETYLSLPCLIGSITLESGDYVSYGFLFPVEGTDYYILKDNIQGAVITKPGVTFKLVNGKWIENNSDVIGFKPIMVINNDI